MTVSGKHTSLQLQGINYDRKKFYSIDPLNASPVTNSDPTGDSLSSPDSYCSTHLWAPRHLVE